MLSRAQNTFHHNPRLRRPVSSSIKTQAFRNLEYNIKKASADLIILQTKGLNFGDLLYCVGLRAPRKKLPTKVSTTQLLTIIDNQAVPALLPNKCLDIACLPI